MPDMSPAPVRLLIVDDHALFRESLSYRLSSQPGFEVVGQCATVTQAVDVVTRTAVDLVLLDIDLGSEQGSAFLREARECQFPGRVLVVTAGVNPIEARRLLRAGAASVFFKDLGIDALMGRIREVAAGAVDTDPLPEEPDQSRVADRHRSLSQPELQVLRLVFEGHANKEISGMLNISESSVKEILQRLFAKTGVRTRGQLVRVAIEKHWKEIGL